MSGRRSATNSARVRSAVGSRTRFAASVSTRRRSSSTSSPGTNRSPAREPRSDRLVLACRCPAPRRGDRDVPPEHRGRRRVAGAGRRFARARAAARDDVHGVSGERTGSRSWPAVRRRTRSSVPVVTESTPGALWRVNWHPESGVPDGKSRQQLDGVHRPRRRSLPLGRLPVGCQARGRSSPSTTSSCDEDSGRRSGRDRPWIPRQDKGSVRVPIRVQRQIEARPA